MLMSVLKKLLPSTCGGSPSIRTELRTHESFLHRRPRVFAIFLYF